MGSIVCPPWTTKKKARAARLIACTKLIAVMVSCVVTAFAFWGAQKPASPSALARRIVESGLAAAMKRAVVKRVTHVAPIRTKCVTVTSGEVKRPVSASTVPTQATSAVLARTPPPRLPHHWPMRGSWVHGGRRPAAKNEKARTPARASPKEREKKRNNPETSWRVLLIFNAQTNERITYDDDEPCLRR
jgi:hypothetical protein